MVALAGLPAGAMLAQPADPPIDLLEDDPDAAPEGLPDPVDDTEIPTLETVPSNSAAMAYPFDRLRLEFATRHPELPLVEAMRGLRLPVTIQSGTVVRVAGPGITLGELLELRDLGVTPEAINGIADAVVAEMNRRGIVGVLVAPDPGGIDPATGRDVRVENEAGDDLVLLIWVGVVEELRTVASGDRLDESADPINHPAHMRIINLSPAKPWQGRAGARGPAPAGGP
ncbi:MAG: hypothetical protein AAFN41_03360 [Planctomycetota bacterium]